MTPNVEAPAKSRRARLLVGPSHAQPDAKPSLRDEDDVIDPTSKVQQVLGVSKDTLERMRKLPNAGGLPFIRLSANRIGYRRGDWRAFIAARRFGAIPRIAR